MDETHKITFEVSSLDKFNDLLFNLSLSGKQKFAKMLIGAAIGFLVAKGVDMAFDDAVKAVRNHKS